MRIAGSVPFQRISAPQNIWKHWNGQRAEAVRHAQFDT
jgi:hypothetical protein